MSDTLESTANLTNAAAYAQVRDQRIREAERAVLAVAEALEAAHVALNVATHRDTKRNLVAKRDRLTLALFDTVRALREARRGTP